MELVVLIYLPSCLCNAYLSKPRWSICNDWLSTNGLIKFHWLPKCNQRHLIMKSAQKSLAQSLFMTWQYDHTHMSSRITKTGTVHWKCLCFHFKLTPIFAHFYISFMICKKKKTNKKLILYIFMYENVSLFSDF